jgi:TP901 family phage tail tape measure protein
MSDKPTIVEFGAELNTAGVESSLKQLRRMLLAAANDDPLSQLGKGAEKNFSQVGLGLVGVLEKMHKDMQAFNQRTVAEAKKTGKAVADAMEAEVGKKTIKVKIEGQYTPYNAQTTLAKELAATQRATQQTYNAMYRYNYREQGKALAQAAKDAADKLKAMNDRLSYLHKGRLDLEKSMASEIKANQTQIAKDMAESAAAQANKLKSLNERLSFLHKERAVIEKTAAAQVKANQVQLAKEAGESQARLLASLKNQTKAMWSGQSADQSAVLTTLKNQSKAMWAEQAQTQQAGLERLKSQSKAMWADKAKEQAAQKKALQDDLSFYHNVLNLKVKAERKAAEEIAAARKAATASAAKAMVNQSMQSPSGDYSVWNAGATGRDYGTLRQAHKPQEGSSLTSSLTPVARLKSDFDAASEGAKRATGSNQTFSRSLNDMHSAARGVASGFNAMWLTWGALVPLLAGAALSNAVVQVVRLGASVDDTMTRLRVLGGESTEAVSALNTQLLELSRSGPFGPQQVAEAMKTLTLAGLNATEVMSSVQDVMNFALAGDTDVKASAEALTTIATAFNVAAGDYVYITDTVSKAAAESKASIESMAEAMKTASVVHQQYGVSLEDTAVGLSLLANAGIQGSAAGTALRNMYVDLAGRTKEVDAILKGLGVTTLDTSGKMRAQADIFRDLMTSLQKNETAEGATKLLQKIFSERGAKEAIAILNALQKKVDETGESVVTAYDALANKIYNAAGTTAMAASELALTPLEQMKSVAASLQTTLVEAFNQAQPYILEVSNQLKSVLRSDEFKGALASLIQAVGNAALAFLEWGKAILSVVLAWQALKGVLGVVAAVGAFGTAATAAAAGTAALGTAAAGTGVAVGGMATALRVATLANPALAVLAGLVTAAGAAWGLYTLNKKRSVIEDQKALSLNRDEYLSKLNEEADRLERIVNLKAQSNALDNVPAVRRADVIGDANAKLAQAEQAMADYNKARGQFNKPLLPKLQSEVDAARAGVEQASELQRYANRGYSAPITRVVDASRAKAEAERERAKKEARDYAALFQGAGTGLDEKSGKGSKAKALSLKLDNELQQVEKRYNEEMQMINKMLGNEQKLLQESLNAKLITQGAFYARELAMANEAESKKLALTDKAEAEYLSAMQRRIGEAWQQYEDALSAAGTKRNSAEVQAESWKVLQAELTNIGNTAETVFKGFANTRKEIKDGALTRMELQAIKAAGAINVIDEEYKDLLKSEEALRRGRERDASTQSALLWATPEQAAFIRASAAETDRLTAQVEKYDAAVVLAERSLKDYVSELEMEWQVTEEQTKQLKYLADALAEIKKRRDELKGAIDTKATEQGIAAVRAFQEQELKRLTDGVADAIVTGLFEGGQAGKKKLRDLIAAELRKPIMLMVQAVVQPIVGGMMQSMGMNAVSSAGGSMLSSVAGSAMSSMGTSFLGAGGLGGTMGAFSTGASAGLAGVDLTAAIAAYTEAGMSGVAAGLTAGSTVGGALAAIPGWGWALAGAALLAGSLDDSGTPHTGGYGAYGPSGASYGGTVRDMAGFNSFNLSDGDIRTEANKSSVDLAKGIVGILDGAANTFGKQAGYSAATAFADDSSDDGAWGALRIKLGERVVADWSDGKGGIPKEFGDGEQGAKDYSKALAQSVREAMIEITPDWADKILNDLGAEPTMEMLVEANAQIEAIAGAFDLLSEAGDGALAALGNLSDAAIGNLIEAAGGAKGLMTNLGAYTDGFATESQKYSAASGKLSEGFQKLGVTMPGLGADLEGWYRDLVQTAAGLDLTVDANAEYLNSLLQLSPAVRAVADADKVTHDLQQQLMVSKGLMTQREVDLQNQLATASSAAQAGLMRLVSASMTAASLWSSISSELQGFASEEEGATDSGGGGGGGGTDEMTQRLVAASDAIKDFIKSITEDPIDELKNSKLEFMRAQARYQDDLAKASTGDVDAMERVSKSAKNLLELQLDRATSASDVRKAQARMAYEMSQLPEFKDEGGGGGSGGTKPLSPLELLNREIKELVKAMKALMISIEETEMGQGAYEAFIDAVEAIASALQAIKDADISVKLKIDAVNILTDLADTLDIAVKATWLDDDLKELVGKAGTALARAIEITVKSKHTEASIKEALESLEGIGRTLRVLVRTEEMDPATRALALAANGMLSTTVSIAMSTQGMSAVDITNVLTIINAADKIVSITATAENIPEELKQIILGTALPSINKIVRLAIEDFTGQDKDIILAAAESVTKEIDLAVKAADPEAIRLALAESFAIEAIVNASNGVLTPEIRTLLASGNVQKLVEMQLQLMAGTYEVDLANLTSPRDVLIKAGLEGAAFEAAIAEYERDRTVSIAALLQPGDTVAELAQLTAEKNVYIKALLDAGATPAQIAELTAATNLDILAILDVAVATDKKAGLTAPDQTLLTAILDTKDATAAKDILLSHGIAPATAVLDANAANATKDQLVSHATLTLDADLDASQANAIKDDVTKPETTKITAQLDATAANETKKALIAPANTVITAVLKGAAEMSASLDALTAPRTVYVTVQTTTVETVVRNYVDGSSPSTSLSGVPASGSGPLGFASSSGFSIEVPPFAAGSNYVPNDMLAMVHEGERILPKADNAELMSTLDRSAALGSTVYSLTRAINQLGDSSAMQPVIDAVIDTNDQLLRIKRKVDDMLLGQIKSIELAEIQLELLEELKGIYVAALEAQAAQMAALLAAQATQTTTLSQAITTQGTALSTVMSAGFSSVTSSVTSMADAVASAVASAVSQAMAAAAASATRGGGGGGGAPTSTAPSPAGVVGGGNPYQPHLDAMATANSFYASNAVAQAYNPNGPDLSAQVYWGDRVLAVGAAAAKSEFENAVLSYASSNPIPAYASGGSHMGGLRLVGENGPEIEATGPSRIWNASQTRQFLSNSEDNGGDEALAELVRDLIEEVQGLRAEAQATAGHTARAAKILGRVTNNGDAVHTSPAPV